MKTLSKQQKRKASAVTFAVAMVLWVISYYAMAWFEKNQLYSIAVSISISALIFIIQWHTTGLQSIATSFFWLFSVENIIDTIFFDPERYVLNDYIALAVIIAVILIRHQKYVRSRSSP